MAFFGGAFLAGAFFAASFFTAAFLAGAFFADFAGFAAFFFAMRRPLPHVTADIPGPASRAARHATARGPALIERVVEHLPLTAKLRANQEESAKGNGVIGHWEKLQAVLRLFPNDE
jgi:hypothetical protein